MLSGVQITPQVAVRQAADLTVEACGHRPAAPFPPLPTQEDIVMAKAVGGKRVVARPTLKPRLDASGSSKQAGMHAGLKRPHDQAAHDPRDGQGQRTWWQPTTGPGSLWVSKGKEPMHAFNKAGSNSNAHAAKRVRIRQPQSKRIKAVLDAHTLACQEATAEVPAGTHSAVHETGLAQGQVALRSMGLLMDRLPPDTLAGIMCLLAYEDLGNLKLTCQGMWRAAKDGAVWRNLLHRQFPCSQLTASSAADWEYTYNLQV